MTCQRALDLIDGVPFIEVSPQDIAAVDAHARDCASCRAALAMTTQMTTGLRSVGESLRVPDVTDQVFARLPAAAPPRELVVEDAERAARFDWTLAPRFCTLGASAAVISGSDLAAAVARQLDGDGPQRLLPALGPAELSILMGLLLYCAALGWPLVGGRGE